VKCIEMEAADYLNKPFNPVLLKARVNASLEKKRLLDKQRELFRKFATDEVAEELLTSGFSLSGKLVDATVLFVDIRYFNDVGEEAGDEIDLVFVGYRQDNVGAFQTPCFPPSFTPFPPFAMPASPSTRIISWDFGIAR
ncbi:MAG: hypothetical protein KKF43_00045, partial [Proteobacteria bacterium]|nr:hypothetical protein [Pseudomonadota bacterium]